VTTSLIERLRTNLAELRVQGLYKSERVLESPQAGLVRTGERGDAIAAAKALATFVVDPAIAAKIRQAAAEQSDAAARAEIARLVDA